MTEHPPEPGMEQPPSGVEEATYKDHRIAYRDDDEGLQLWIDGHSWGHMVDRLGPEQYYSHLLPFMEYPSAEALAQALVDREGEAWVAEEGGQDSGPSGSHDHAG
jgi:hypothetical protein